MKRWNTIQIVALAGALGLGAWQYAFHIRQSRTLVALQTQAGSKTRELESCKAALAELNEQKSALLEHKKASEASVVAPLMRERAEATASRSAAEAAARAEKGRVYRHAMAAALDDPGQRELGRQLLHSEVKSRTAPLVKKLNLSPEQTDRLHDLLVDYELQKNDRIAALLRDDVSVADALQQRDAAHQESQNQLRALLGDDGYALFDEDNQKAQKANVDRVLNWMKSHLGDHSLDDRQSARLGELILAEFANVTADETDAFRPAHDLEQWMTDHQQNIIQQIAPSLTAEQLAALNNLAAEDRANAQERIDSTRRIYGLTGD
jgi:hypothetical protein